MYIVGREIEERWLVKGDTDPDGIEVFGPSRKTAPVSLISRNCWLFFQPGGPDAETCYVWV